MCWPVMAQLHRSEKAGEEEERADNEKGGWTQNDDKHVFDSRRDSDFIDLVIGPPAHRGVAHNGMVGDDPSHQQRLEIVQRDDPRRPLPLESARFPQGPFASVGPPRCQHANDPATLNSTAPEARFSSRRTLELVIWC